MKLRPHFSQDQWIEFQYGRLSDDGRREFDRHFDGCVECRDFADGLAAVRTLFRVDVPAPSADQWAGMRRLLLEDFRRGRPAAGAQVLDNLRNAAGRIWLFLTDDPLAAMAYTCSATGYLLYSLLTMSELQSLVPGPDQVLSLIRFAF